MSNAEPPTFELQPVGLTLGPSIATWRFVGDRGAADLAYCARFGTTEAPEPTVALGGAWAYPLPGPQPPQ